MGEGRGWWGEGDGVEGERGGEGEEGEERGEWGGEMDVRGALHFRWFTYIAAVYKGPPYQCGSLRD